MKRIVILFVSALFFVSLSAQSIAGVSFGSSYESAKASLINKWGKPARIDNNSIAFDYVSYANLSFDNVIFGFQRDNNGKSYMNRCIFVKHAKDRDEALEAMEQFHFVLQKKYLIYRVGEYDEDFYYYGGNSPLGDDKDLFLIDYIKYTDDAGGGYGARIYYGPFEYVKEEF